MVQDQTIPQIAIDGIVDEIIENPRIAIGEKIIFNRIEVIAERMNLKIDDGVVCRVVNHE